MLIFNQSDKGTKQKRNIIKYKSSIIIKYVSHKHIYKIFVFIGQRPASMPENEVYEKRWIPERWAIVGESRVRFVQCVLERFCGPLISKLKLAVGTEFTTDFALGTDPAQMSIVDQLVASLIGYNWSVVGFLSCTDIPEQDNLDSISRFEFTKAKNFLENWLRTEGYRCLSIGPRSAQFRVNLYESARWENGIIVGQEASNPRDFYQVNRTFVKVGVNEAMHRYGEEMWNSTSPLDFGRKITKVCILTFCFPFL